MALDATDIYLTDEICFDIKDAAAVVHSSGAKVRIYPNVAQSRFGRMRDVFCFFVRPEDIDLYEPFVDVCEIWPADDKRTEVLLEIYKNKKEWFGPLNEIISNFDSPIDGKHILPIFGQRRLYCKKRCMHGTTCGICSEW